MDIIDLLKYITGNSFITTLSGVIVGGYITYKFNEYSKNKEITDHAIASTILIRNYLVEQFDRTNILIRNLNQRLTILQNHAGNFSDWHLWPEEEFNSVTEKLIMPPQLYGWNFRLIERISLIRNSFENFEQALQSLSRVTGERARVQETINGFNQMKRELADNRIDDALQNYQTDQINHQNTIQNDMIFFLGALERELPDWIDNCRRAEETIRDIFDKFQTDICEPLKIQTINIE